jgi:hypothetical protein
MHKQAMADCARMAQRSAAWRSVAETALGADLALRERDAILARYLVDSQRVQTARLAQRANLYLALGDSFEASASTPSRLSGLADARSTPFKARPVSTPAPDRRRSSSRPGRWNPCRDPFQRPCHSG